MRNAHVVAALGGVAHVGDFVQAYVRETEATSS